MKRVLVRAPSNIALVKYMGKSDASRNLPANASLSLTLDSLCTWLEIGAGPSDSVRHVEFATEPLRRVGVDEAGSRVDEAGRTRFLAHFSRVLDHLPALLASHGLKTETRRRFRLRAANTFPRSSGIASSASSFAALTLGAAAAICDDGMRFERVYAEDASFRRELAALAREGSGSSCRSFEGPWVRWVGERAEAIPSVSTDVAHFVVLVDREAKRVSSSQAHALVTSSPLWSGRAQRADSRVERVADGLHSGDWRRVARLAWEEMLEMHSLFHTCAEPFFFWKGDSVEILRTLQPFALDAASARPPVVTMDAGPNVHVTVPAAEGARWRTFFSERFPNLTLLEDRAGAGAQVVEHAFLP